MKCDVYVITPELNLGFHVPSICGTRDWVDGELGGMAEVCSSVMLLMETMKTRSPIQMKNFCAFGEICQSSATSLKPIPLTSIVRSVCVALGVAILMQMHTYVSNVTK